MAAATAKVWLMEFRAEAGLGFVRVRVSGFLFSGVRFRCREKNAKSRERENFRERNFKRERIEEREREFLRYVFFFLCFFFLPYFWFSTKGALSCGEAQREDDILCLRGTT